MNKRRFIPFVLSILTGCGGKSVTNPTVLLDAESYTNIGIQAFVKADWGQAKWSFNRALSLYQGIDDQLGVLSSHINLAEVALSLHDSPTVKTNLSHASNIANISLQQYQTRITLLYALDALQQKQIPLAKSLLQSLLPEFDKKALVSIPDIIQMTALANRTKISFIQNQNKILWTQRYANGLKLLADKNYGLEARLLRFQSILLQQQGRHEASESHLQQALSKYKENIFRPGIAETFFELGKLYITENRWQDAHLYLNRSINIFRYLGTNAKVIEVKEKLINVEMKLGNLKRREALKQEQ